MGSTTHDVSLMDDPVAQRLLTSTAPARLAYTWSDGTPRVVPIWFHWDDKTIVLGTPAKAQVEGVGQPARRCGHHRHHRLSLPRTFHPRTC